MYAFGGTFCGRRPFSLRFHLTNSLVYHLEIKKGDLDFRKFFELRFRNEKPTFRKLKVVWPVTRLRMGAGF